MAAAGSAIALGMGYLIECARRKHQIAYDDSHPRALVRMSMNSVLSEVLGIHKQTYLARRFAELLEACRKQFFPNEQKPWIFGESGTEIIPVFESLRIPLPTTAELLRSRLTLSGLTLPPIQSDLLDRIGARYGDRGGGGLGR